MRFVICSGRDAGTAGKVSCLQGRRSHMKIAETMVRHTTMRHDQRHYIARHSTHKTLRPQPNPLLQVRLVPVGPHPPISTSTHRTASRPVQQHIPQSHSAVPQQGAGDTCYMGTQWDVRAHSGCIALCTAEYRPGARSCTSSSAVYSQERSSSKAFWASSATEHTAGRRGRPR